VVAAGFGAVALAAHQISVSIWTLLAFALDAIAIAGQAIIGRTLGAGDATLGRAMTRRMIGWGLVFGVAFGLVMALTSPLYVGLFTPDRQVQALLGQVLVVMAVAAPIAGVVFVLDGVLIGAGDGRYLALASLIALVAYVPAAIAVEQAAAGLVWLWAAYGWYVTARMLTLLWRIRGDAWLRTGST
jgi:Na+-driven multidrug efflux pump